MKDRNAIPFLFLFFLNFTFSQSVKDSVSIFYDIDKYVLTSNHKIKINSFLESIDTTFTYKVNIISSADYLGSLENNKILAGKRAKEIELMLLSEFPKMFSSFTLVNKGEIIEEEKEKTKDILGNKDNRKTTIIFIKPKPISKVKLLSKKKKTYIYNPVKTEFDLYIGNKFILKRLIFYRGTDKMKPSSKQSLKRLLRFFRENPKVEVEIQGHLCCNAGKYQPDKLKIKPLNYDNLSSRRARLVYKYLVLNGVKKSRLKYNGYGFQNPLHYPEISEKNKSLNKRVEIVITKF